MYPNTNTKTPMSRITVTPIPNSNPKPDQRQDIMQIDVVYASSHFHFFYISILSVTGPSAPLDFFPDPS